MKPLCFFPKKNKSMTEPPVASQTATLADIVPTETNGRPKMETKATAETDKLLATTATEPEVKKTRPATPRQVACVSLVALVIFAVPLVYLNEIPAMTPSGSSGPSSFHFNQLFSMCNAPVPYGFVLNSVQTNDTTMVYVLPQADIQVTQVLHHGVRVHTEIQDFRQQVTVVFPQGRVSATDTNCQLFELVAGKEQSWNSLACKGDGTMFLEATQMRLQADATPARDLPADFFQLPTSCVKPWERDSTNESPPAAVWQPWVSKFMVQPQNRTLLPDMLRDVLSLLELEFGTAYAQTPALVSVLSTLYARYARDYLTTAASFSAADYTLNTTSAAVECCGGPHNAHCIQQMELHGTTLGVQCQTYRTCVANENDLWVSATPGKPLPFQVCNGYDERRCYCDSRLALNVFAPGASECGDCLADENNCDCYLTLWFLRYMYRQRPCWCQGACTHSPFAYLCGARPECSGWLSKTCEYFLTWCPRNEVYPCYTCHAHGGDDSGNVCVTSL